MEPDRKHVLLEPDKSRLLRLSAKLPMDPSTYNSDEMEIANRIVCQWLNEQWLTRNQTEHNLSFHGGPMDGQKIKYCVDGDASLLPATMIFEVEVKAEVVIKFEPFTGKVRHVYHRMFRGEVGLPSYRHCGTETVCSF